MIQTFEKNVKKFLKTYLPRPSFLLRRPRCTQTSFPTAHPHRREYSMTPNKERLWSCSAKNWLQPACCPFDWKKSFQIRWIHFASLKLTNCSDSRVWGVFRYSCYKRNLSSPSRKGVWERGRCTWWYLRASMLRPARRETVLGWSLLTFFFFSSNNQRRNHKQRSQKKCQDIVKIPVDICLHFFKFNIIKKCHECLFLNYEYTYILSDTRFLIQRNIRCRTRQS